MTEIPEHLLRRSRERRAALGGGGDAGDAGAPSEAAATPATTAPAAAATPTPAAAPAPAAPPPPPPRPKPYVEASKRRRRVPVWAVPVVGILPLWAFLYAESLREPEVVLTGPLAEGEEVYLSACSGCHGAGGAGGAGRQLNGGEVLLTFPAEMIQAQVDFVKHGSSDLLGQPYGNLDRPGGAHTGGSYNGAPMPAQGIDFGGSLTDEQVLAAVCHERELSGEEATPICTGEAPLEGGEGGEGEVPGAGGSDAEAGEAGTGSAEAAH